MPSITIIAAASALYGAAVVSAHGHVTGATTPDGTFHQGWDPDKGMGYSNNFPKVVGWQTDVKDNGFVSKESYSKPDIICHLGAKNAAKSIDIAAGDVLTLTWSTWPESHHGPVMDYLASCGSKACSSVDKTSLRFFKISEVGAIVPGNGNAGLWGADLIVQNNMQWQVQIPSSIASGEYVLRHEILSLHQNGQPQNYPQCLNLKVTGGGGDSPDGVLGTELYTDYKDFNIYQDFDSYPIPGPPMIDGAAPILDQGSSVPSSGGGNGNNNGGGGGSSSDADDSKSGGNSGGESAQPTATKGSFLPTPTPNTGSNPAPGSGSGDGENGGSQVYSSKTSLFVAIISAFALVFLHS